MTGAPYLQIGKDVVSARRKIEPSARTTPVAADLVTPPYGHVFPMVIDGGNAISCTVRMKLIESAILPALLLVNLNNGNILLKANNERAFEPDTYFLFRFAISPHISSQVMILS